jgi:hypothetical protein
MRTVSDMAEDLHLVAKTSNLFGVFERSSNLSRTCSEIVAVSTRILSYCFKIRYISSIGYSTYVRSHLVTTS